MDNIEYRKQYYIKNKERIKNYAKEYYKKNKNKILIKQKQYFYNWYHKNKNKTKKIKNDESKIIKKFVDKITVSF